MHIIQDSRASLTNADVANCHRFAFHLGFVLDCTKPYCSCYLNLSVSSTCYYNNYVLGLNECSRPDFRYLSFTSSPNIQYQV